MRSAVRVVPCPTCGGPSLYAPENRWRPFCSERCRSIDFGAWATERYRVPVKPDPEDDEETRPE
jgi:endogenous inhibitor of DNA gyrase (YacG/DUF329 family)